MDRFNAYEKIKALNPETQHWDIIRLSVFYEFPWDYARALELALFRTFASPSISSLLYKTGEFEKRTQKRYDDTDLILSEILENGLESERAQEAIKKLNFIHGHFNISNEDYLYVLSTFIFEPERWVNKYGYRQLCDNELKAGYKVWQELGALMNIKNIPQNRQALEQFNRDYEARNFVYSDSNHRVALQTENLLLAWFLPTGLYNIGRPFLHAVMDKPLLNAVGYTKPAWPVQKAVDAAFSLRKIMVRLLPQRKKAVLRTSIKRPDSYPKGYAVNELGSKQY